MTLIKSKVPMPVYLSKYQGLKQTPTYRENYDDIFGKRGVFYHNRRSGKKVVEIKRRGDDQG